MLDEHDEELWALITEDGGMTTADFDPDVIPEGYLKKPGILVRAKTPPPAEASVLPGFLGAALRRDDPPVYLEVVYENSGTYVPAVGVTVTGLYWDLQPNEPNISVDATVPASGIVSFACPEPIYQELRVSGEVPNTSYVGRRSVLGGYVVDSDNCGDTIQVVAGKYTYTAWKNLNTVIPIINSHLGYSRSAVAFRYDAGAGNSYYSSGADEIVFASAGALTPWTAAHEYGHALHHASLGGLWSVTDCNPHGPGTPSSYTCALLEGFADYVGNVGVGQPSAWENLHYSTRPAEDEGNVGALFTDLIDANNETGDQTTYSGYYVATVFKTCQVNITIWLARNDPSDFVWCLENRVNSTVHTQKFPGISIPYYVLENATEPQGWNADNIRSTWLFNIG